MVIGSMDDLSLYTRLEAERSANIVKEEIKKSNIKFENIDE